MLVATIANKDCLSIQKELNKMKNYPVDAVELRFDYLSEIDLIAIKKIVNSLSIPKIFTLRKKTQGGHFVGDERKRLQLIRKLISLEPEYFDLEHDINSDFIKRIHIAHPKVKLISSYHNFKNTPQDLEVILNKMKKPEFYGYKVATKANSTIDTLRMLNFVNQSSRSINITGISMGKLGEASRILAPIVKNYFNFTHLGQKTAPGQISIKTLLELYNYKKLNAKTSIYALLGDPTEQSIGHVFHNQIFKNKNINAIYVKLNLKAFELNRFFALIKHLPFKGLSITMPLKERILPYLDKFDSDAATIQAINTIVIGKRKYFGCNTDGMGALNAIEKKIKVENKNIIIIGAGGTAKAIAHEAVRRGGRVTILNRSEFKAKKIAKAFGCHGFGFDYFAKLAIAKFDLLINATSIGMKNNHETLPIPKKLFTSKLIVLDVVSQNTLLLKTATKNDCRTITGEQVFIQQALLQQAIWSRGLTPYDSA